MKKLALTALAAAIATIGVASAASAQSGYDDDQWPRQERRQDDNGRWDGRRSDDRGWDHGRDRDGGRDHGRDRDRDRWRHDDRHGHWQRPHYRPRVIYRYEPVCFVKKIRRYDDWGNVYIKKVRVCR